MRNSEDLTIVILSRDRHRDLMKTIQYYSQIGIQTVVLHKTQKPLPSQILPNSCRYSIVDKPYAYRCEMASESITSQYALLSSDDERYLPSALTEMMSSMREQNNHGSVGARNLAIGRYGKRITATESFSNLNNYSNQEDQFELAVDKHFSTDLSSVRVGALYRMYSNEDFKTLFRALSKGDVANTPYIFECIAEIASLALGPVKYIPQLYWLRNWTNKMVSLEDWNRKITFGSWWHDFQNEASKNSLLIKLEAELGIELGQLEHAFGRLTNNRAKAEAKIIPKKIYLPISDDLKYFVKRTIGSRHLPVTLHDALDLLKIDGVGYSDLEVESGLISMLEND